MHATGSVFAAQVFLAMPNDCPVAPDGSKRSVPSGADERNSVAMYTSEDNAQTFKSVCAAGFECARMRKCVRVAIVCSACSLNVQLEWKQAISSKAGLQLLSWSSAALADHYAASK